MSATAAAEEDAEPFEEKMKRLTATLREQMAEGARLDERIGSSLVVACDLNRDQVADDIDGAGP